jgi:hypothetical protein
MGGSVAAKSKTVTDEVDEMFDTSGEFSGDDDFDDMLDAVEEDDSEGWVPDEKGEGIAGIVVKVGQARSDFAKDGEDPMVPSVTIQTSNGDKFRVIGYGSVLRRELLDANPHVGDKIAVKFFGEKPVRKGKYAGKLYKHFGVIVRRTDQGKTGQSLADAQAQQ